MKCPFRINREHSSNGYNSSDKYTYAECYENNCPFYYTKNSKDMCKRTELNNSISNSENM